MRQNVLVKVRKKGSVKHYNWSSICLENPNRTTEDEIVLIKEDIKNLEEEIKDLNKIVNLCTRKRKELNELKGLLRLCEEEANK